MNDWRYLRYRPGKAHQWALTPGGIWRSSCGHMAVIDLFETTYSLAGGNGLILKCRQCQQWGVRQGAAA